MSRWSMMRTALRWIVAAGCAIAVLVPPSTIDDLLAIAVPDAVQTQDEREEGAKETAEAKTLAVSLSRNVVAPSSPRRRLSLVNRPDVVEHPSAVGSADRCARPHTLPLRC